MSGFITPAVIKHVPILAKFVIRALKPRAALEHDPEKRVPVFRKDHAQTKRSGNTDRLEVR
jgi:hypothetical protein